MRQTTLGWTLVAALVLVHAPGRADDLKDDIRYTELSNALGNALATGAGVRVGQVEALSGDNYLPSQMPPTNAEFLGKSFAAQSGPSGNSNHAVGVGRLFYGSTSPIAPGISEIEAYETTDWLGSFLNVGTNQAPLAPTARVFNHSWVGAAEDPPLNLDILRRLDHVVEQYDAVQVVAVNNGTTHQPLLSHAMNVIAVGRSNGTNPAGTIDLGDPQNVYVAGRSGPDLVAPRTTVSHATAIVSSAAALLVDAATANPHWSNDSYQVGSQTIQHAASSEVIKAALMAGARRETLDNYTVNTQNGLSSVFGAGELDIYHSYHILAAGEQDGGTPLDAPVMIDAYGFDYAAAFAPSDVAWYHFELATDLAVTLAWNVAIEGPFDGSDPAALLPHFELNLYLLEGNDATLVASSASAIDNTQSLWLTDLDPTASYRLEVLRTDALGSHDYGLAWRMTIVPEPSTLALALLGTVGLLANLRRRRRPNA